MSILVGLLDRGFDLSRSAPEGGRYVAACSRCAAIVINGLPCHESGCSNAVFECRGCDAWVSRRGAYCEDCN